MVEKINRLIYSARVFLTAVLLLNASYAAAASAGGITLISDAETQSYLAQVVRPLFAAADIPFDENKLFIVNDNSLNAFVSDGNYLFVHTGTLLAIDDTNELAGILAHETGHILGGHIVRQKLKLENMHYVMLGSMIAAGAAAVSTGRGDAAMAVLLGSQSSALNSLLNYQIQEERSADESAVKLLARTKQSTTGLKRFMSKIKQQNALSGIQESSYFRTHPMTTERISHFNEASKNNHFGTQNTLDGKLAYVKAKLSAFLEEPAKVRRRYPSGRTNAPDRYAHAILFFKEGKLQQALDTMETLLKSQPDNPYFYELKGQFLFESGKIKDSIAAYREALKRLPDSADLQVSLAHALLESSPQKQDVQEAIALLQRSLIKQNSAYAWQMLAQAYSADGNEAAAYYAAAEFNYAIRNPDGARKQIERAKKAADTQQLRLKISDLEERIKADLK